MKPMTGRSQLWGEDPPNDYTNDLASVLFRLSQSHSEVLTGRAKGSLREVLLHVHVVFYQEATAR